MLCPSASLFCRQNTGSRAVYVYACVLMSARSAHLRVSLLFYKKQRTGSVSIYTCLHCLQPARIDAYFRNADKDWRLYTHSCSVCSDVCMCRLLSMHQFPNTFQRAVKISCTSRIGGAHEVKPLELKHSPTQAKTETDHTSTMAYHAPYRSVCC